MIVFSRGSVTNTAVQSPHDRLANVFAWCPTHCRSGRTQCAAPTDRAGYNEQGIRVGPGAVRHGYRRPPAKGVLHFRAFPRGVPLTAGRASTIEQGVVAYRTCVGAAWIAALVARFGTALS